MILAENKKEPSKNDDSLKKPNYEKLNILSYC